jgi:hypothetical protein
VPKFKAQRKPKVTTTIHTVTTTVTTVTTAAASTKVTPKATAKAAPKATAKVTGENTVKATPNPKASKSAPKATPQLYQRPHSTWHPSLPVLPSPPTPRPAAEVNSSAVRDRSRLTPPQRQPASPFHAM